MDVVYPRNAGLNPIADENLTISTQVVALAHAQGTLTLDTNPTDTDTMTIGGKVYTFQSSLTDADGNIEIAGTLAATKTNVINAINLTGTPGTGYAASMTLHPTVYASAAWVGNDLVLTAKTRGTAGNSIATTETFTTGTNVFDAGTLGTTYAGLDVGDFANIVVVDNGIRLRHGSDPVATSSGLLLAAGDTWMISDKELADTRLLRESADTAIWVQYYA